MGRPDIMDIYEPNTMTSTHTGNPVCSAAAIANLDYLVKHKLVANAAKVGAVLRGLLDNIAARHSDVVGVVQGKGLVYGMAIVKEGTKEPNADLAHTVVRKCVEKGLLLFAPVGFGSATVKIGPPLTITADAIKDGCQCLEEAIIEAKIEMLGEGDNN
jgi:4-aminobutyrate aminotransferase / (S)-3-amino-2-methylpropionate transaminase / 5-aminovalerate transaminase